MRTVMVLSLSLMIGLIAASSALAGECRALIISGDPGPSVMAADRFHRWSQQWRDTLLSVYTFREANITVLWSPLRPGGAPEEGHPSTPVAELSKVAPTDLASLANVQAAYAKLVAESTDQDQVVVVLIGNGYEDQKLSKLALPGKDLSDVDTKRALEKLKAKELVVINTAPASYEWVESLSRQGRVIIVADAEVGMGNQAYFCEFLLRALNRKTNLLDGFNQAAVATLQWYQNQFKDEGGTTVHGREYQEVYALMYPGRQITPGDAAPRPADNDAKNMEAWLGRRVINEVAGLDDNGDGQLSTVYSEGKKPAPLPSKSGDGEFAKTIVLGVP